MKDKIREIIAQNFGVWKAQYDPVIKELHELFEKELTKLKQLDNRMIHSLKQSYDNEIAELKAKLKEE